MPSILIVFLGAGIGGVLRHLVNVNSPRWWGASFPWGTFAINVSGSFLIGLVAGWLAFKAQAPWSTQARFFVVTGILGGYTTFSSFSLDAMLLIERGEVGAAVGYALGSVILSLIAVAAGLWIVRSFA